MTGTEDWLAIAIRDGDIDGCQLGVDGTDLAQAETFAGRKFYFQDALGGAKASATFSPDGKDKTGKQTSAVVVSPALWKANVLDPMNGVGVPHPIQTFPNILGVRGSDPTWPGHAAIDVWIPGDGSFVDKAVSQWAGLLGMLRRLTAVRLWHEMGNGVYATADHALFIRNWRKVVERFRALGCTNVAFAWVPAAHPAHPGSDVESYPGDDWVDVIGRDVYNNPPNTWADSAQAWYDEFSTHPRPLIVFESGIEVTDPKRMANLTELGTLLKGDWSRISGLLWWSGAGNDLVDTPKGFQAAYRAIFSDPYFLPDGMVGTTPPVQVAVPNVVGMTISAAVQALDAVGLVAAGDTSGTVWTQTPTAGTLVDVGSTVTLSVSTDPCADVKVQLEASQAEVTDLTAKNAALSAQLDDVTSSLDEALSTVSVLTTKIAKATADLG